MSPLLQKRRPTHSPLNHQSVSSPAKTQHPHRAFGFTSIRELGKSSSRQTLRTLSPNVQQQPYSHGCSPPKDGVLKPPKAIKDPGSPLASESGRQQSRDSSIESLPVDKSGISNDSTYATTPSPAKHRAFQLLEPSPPVQRKSMGNKGSTVLKKPIPFDRKKRSAAVTRDTDESIGHSHQQASDRSQQPVTFSARPSSVMVNVPRRRSSLTALHLDSSHFETPDPQRQNMQHRASTLTEPSRRLSIPAETIRPLTTIMLSSSDTKPTIQVQQRETLSPGFLSPPLLSPALSNSQLSSASSQAPSPKSPNSGRPTYIHLPKTFPDGPIETPAPPLTVTQRKCYLSHRRIIPSRNKACPVPCMTCGEKEGKLRWKCMWCGLRICPACMAGFEANHRNLDDFLASLEKGKEGSQEGGSKGKDEVQELDGGRELTESKREKTPDDKESRRVSSAATGKSLTASK